MEARALKSSFLSQKLSTTQQQQVVVDDFWCVIGTNNNLDDFSVDNFLDFSNKDATSDFLQQSHEDDFEDKDYDVHSSNSITSRKSADFDTLTAAELTLPVNIVDVCTILK